MKIPPPNLRAPDFLELGAETFRSRNATYGDTYRQFGEVMSAMFPEGLSVYDVDDWNRLGVFVMCVGKLCRYSANLIEGGHKDSAHDLMVYAAMLEELTENDRSV